MATNTPLTTAELNEIERLIGEYVDSGWDGLLFPPYDSLRRLVAMARRAERLEAVLRRTEPILERAAWHTIVHCRVKDCCSRESRDADGDRVVYPQGLVRWALGDAWKDVHAALTPAQEETP